MENQTTTTEEKEFETVEEYVENMPVNDFLPVTYFDNNDAYNQMWLGTEFGRVEFEEGHYLVILQGENREIIGPFKNEDDVSREASSYATDTALSILASYYREITYKQFRRARKLGLSVVTDKYGQDYIKTEDFCDVEDVEEEEEDDE